MGEAIEERGCHLGIPEDLGPFGEAEVGCDDDAGALVELAEQVEQQCPAGRTERQVAKLVEDVGETRLLCSTNPSKAGGRAMSVGFSASQTSAIEPGSV